MRKTKPSDGRRPRARNGCRLLLTASFITAACSAGIGADPGEDGTSGDSPSEPGNTQTPGSGAGGSPSAPGGSPATPGDAPGATALLPVRIRRLSNFEYDRTIAALLPMPITFP